MSAAVEEEVAMSYGPVEVMVVKFPGNKFRGEIVPALREVVDRGDVRIIDLVFVAKSPAGEVLGVELSELTGDEAAALDPITGGEMSPLLNDEDIDTIAEQLEPNSSAGILVFEHLWAAQLAQAFANADAEVIMTERIPAPVVAEVMAALEQA
jgi:hypothetical protein